MLCAYDNRLPLCIILQSCLKATVKSQECHWSTRQSQGQKDGGRDIRRTFPGFPGGLDGKESACNVGDPGSIPGSGSSPGGGHGNPLQYSCLENPIQSSLVGYSPCSPKESDVPEWLTHRERIHEASFSDSNEHVVDKWDKMHQSQSPR